MLTGKWNASMASPLGELKAVLDLTVEGDAVTGTLSDDKGPSPISDGKVNGSEFTFKVKLKTPMGPMPFAFTGKVEGDKLSGKAKMAMGALDFTADRA